MKKNLFHLLLLILIGGSGAFGQTILRVNEAATGGTRNGQSWATAFTKLEDAIAAASPTASVPVEIWVAKGTYKPTTGTDRNAAFRLKSYLTIRGGFYGDETSKDQRDQKDANGNVTRSHYANPTVLSGDIGTPMVGAITSLNEFPAQFPSTTDAGWADNSYNVLVGDRVTNVTLEFLTVTGAAATEASVTEGDIAGYTTYSANPATVGAQSVLKPSSKVVGGGLYFTEGATWTVNNYSLQMIGVTFALNRARAFGGAVGLYDACAYIYGCTFRNNISDGTGGAFWGLNQQAGFIRSDFTDNTSQKGGGAISLIGIPSVRSSEKVDLLGDAIVAVGFAITSTEKFTTETKQDVKNRISKTLTDYGLFNAARDPNQPGLLQTIMKDLPENPITKSDIKLAAKVVSTARDVKNKVVEIKKIQGMSAKITPTNLYAVVQLSVAVGDTVVAVLDRFGLVDHDNPHYQNWNTFSINFNKYATPTGLVQTALTSYLDSKDFVTPAMLAVKKNHLQNYFTLAGRSAFVSCRFVGNETQAVGGAIEIAFNNLLVESCTFTDNHAVMDGAAISSAVFCAPQVVSSVFSNNYCDLGASAISNTASSLMFVSNCTIINNKSFDTDGAALSSTMGADVRVYNSLLWNNANTTVQKGADVMVTTPDDMTADVRKKYDALTDGEQANWVGIMDIRNSIVQSLATIPLGVDKLDLKLGGNAWMMSQLEIDAMVAKAIATRNEADARGELESSGSVNAGWGVRPKLRDPSYGNSAQDPLLLSSPLGKPSYNSPVYNAGNDLWSTGRLIQHAVDLVNIMDVTEKKRIQNARVDIGAYEINPSVPDTAPLASQTTEATAYSGPAASGIGGGLVVPVIGSSTPAGTTVYYVKPTASGNGSGSSWVNATSDLQSAISHANAEVWVATGTYKPTSGSDRTISFSMANGVKVFGGFAGTEAKRSDRNWKTNTTIISGDIGTPNDANDNSKNLFKNTGVSSSAVLDGFTLRDASSADADGGAILNTESAPLIQNCVFQSNHARNGGAIYSTGTAVIGSVLVNCEFRNNSALAAGGAIRYSGQSLFGSNLIFSGNSAMSGGGAISAAGVAGDQYCTIQNGLFYNNSSSTGAGGAIASTGVFLNVVNSTFYGNSAAVNSSQKAGGGAISHSYSVDAGMASAVIYNSIFYKNAATNSGTGSIETVEKRQIQTADALLLSHSLVQGLKVYKGDELSANFDGDPSFVAEGSDFRLLYRSLAIDVGDEPSNFYLASLTTDLDGRSRSINGGIDLGPYEYYGSAVEHPVRTVTQTSTGSESFTFSAAYNAVSGDTVRWYVDRGDGLGYVPLVESAENVGVYTSTLTVNSPSNGFSYRLQVSQNGFTFFSPATKLSPTPDTIAKYAYVKPIATGEGDGSSWADATSDLQSAISLPGRRVWVAAGTYKPTGGADRDACFSMAAGVKIYGGLIGNETTLAEDRDRTAHVTYIDGEIGSPAATDNSKHLFKNTDMGNSGLLDGLHFRNAYSTDADGGAIQNINSRPTIQNCVFSSNHARNGGAVSSTGSPADSFGPVFINCEFRFNEAELNGGAVISDGSWSGTNVIFRDNRAQQGGAIYSSGNSDGQNCTLKNALLVRNSATNGPGGAVWTSGMTMWVLNSTFARNTAHSTIQQGGGGIYHDFPDPNSANLIVSNSIFFNNQSSNSDGSPSLEKQQISQTTGSGYSVSNSLIEGLQLYTGRGNINADPLFVDVDQSNFRVSSGSLTIDAGDTSGEVGRLTATDLDGGSRVKNDVVDLGPYEREPSAPSPLRNVTASSASLENYRFTVNYDALPGDSLQWYVDRGDGNGFVALGDREPGNSTLPVQYQGMTTNSVTILTPPSGYLFMLKLVRNGVTSSSPISALNPTEISKGSYIYVRPKATGDGSGSGWKNATSDLQAAISHPNAQVWVQAGTYYPTSGTDRDASFSMTTYGVKIYGGFKGNEVVRDARNSVLNVTKISGNIGSLTSAQDNSRHLFKNTGTARSTILDGFTLEGAYADGEDGGAILNVGATPTIQNCVFQNNYARNGGAIYSTGTPINGWASDIINCQFRNNTAELLGGAISANSSLAVTNVVFQRNQAGAGGAVNLDVSSSGRVFTVKNGLFTDNLALNGYGGAIYSKGLSLTISNSTFYGNRSTLNSSSRVGGGAIYQDYVVSGTTTVQVYNSILYGNSSTNPGAGGLASLEFQQIAIKGDYAGQARNSLIQGLDKYARLSADANFNEDPAFVNAAAGDFHLSNASGAINSGILSNGGSYLLADTDLDGNARVLAGSVDLGPYEFTQASALGRLIQTSDFSSGVPRFIKSASFTVQTGDVLQWYVDRGDGQGFVPLVADGVYSGVNSLQLTITGPPGSANGYLFRLQVVRGGETFTTVASGLTLPLSRIYVNADRANLSADGASWNTAYGDLDDALKASGPGSSIWVAGGTYYPTDGANVDAAFQMPAMVKIYGGFAAGATTLDSRSLTQNPTILSGRLNGTVSRSDYSRHVVMNSAATDRTALLDGFILQDAYASLMVNDGASPTIRNCVFRNNDSTLSANGEGAAISNLNGANPLIAECRFLRNTGWIGGALFLSGSSATVENSLFAYNSAGAYGGAIVASGGSTLNLVNCTVVANTSQGYTAGLVAFDSTVTISNSIFWNNKTSYPQYSTYDQAIRATESTVTINSSCVQGGDTLPAGNLAVDPLFAPSQGQDGFALAAYSPLINTGTTAYPVSASTDLVGGARVFEGQPDMGAYELQTNAPVVKVKITSLPKSFTSYEIGGYHDFVVTWPAGQTLNPSWKVVDAGGNTVAPSRYTIIQFVSNSLTLRFKDIALTDSGSQISFTDVAQGLLYTPPATLTVKVPRTVFVNPAATGTNDGSSWTNAYPDLATAVDQAQTADEIWVVGGTYTAGSYAYFNLKPTVRLYGGFVGTETARSQRDYVAHPTILHPVGGYPIVYGAALESEYGIPSVLDGFILENGVGAATVYNSTASTSYRNCIFRNNAGYFGNFQSQVTYENCEFTGNTGSSLFYISESTVVLGGSIRNNTTTGDLISSYNASTVTFSDFVAADNTAAGAFFRSSNGSQGASSVTVLRSAFRGNSTGGGVIANGPGTTGVIESSLFARNIASGGLATIQNSGTLTMNFVTVADNRGGSFGGGLFTYVGGISTINNSILWGNRGTRLSAALLAQQTGDSAGTSGTGTVTITRSFIEGINTPLTAYNSETNMGFYPLFADPVTGDYHLPSNSPAATTAPTNFPLLSATDLDKVPRRNGYGAVGAYESPDTLDTPLLISTYPASVTTAETTDTSFTYVGQGTKQWQYFDGTDWVNITGNTSAYRIITDSATQTSTLYFDSPAAALDGTRYRLVITLGGVPYTSGELVLTVKKPKILYVNGGAAASGNGGSWATAFKTIPEALAVTDEYSEIWVKAGSYAINTVYLTWKAHLYGGFAGNETQRSQRDWTANEVTLVGGGKQILISADSTASRKGKTSDAVVDGFTLVGSTAQAAVYLSNSDATIANCTFRGNNSAVGVSGQSNPVITNSVFEGQTARVLSLEGDTVSITDCTFQDNVSPSDSIVYVQRGKVTVTASSFTGNTAMNGVVFVYSDADAMTQAYAMNSTVTHFTMTRSRMTGNTAYAGLYSSKSLIDLDNSLLAKNTLTSSAVLDAGRSVINLTNVTVADNTGTFECVGVQGSGTLYLANSIVWGNRTSWSYGQAAHPNESAAAILEYNQIKFGTNNTVNNSIIEGGYRVTYGANPSANSAYDPLFVDAAALNYQLSAVSPAINVGINGGAPFDIDGQPRTVGSTTDVGAYEFAGTPSSPIRVNSNLSSKTLVAGQGIQFSAAVPAGVNLQWQVKNGATWDNIVTGESQALSSDGKTVTLTNVPLSMSGWQYRYVLSGDVSYTSGGAVLTVTPKPIIYVDLSATGGARDGTSWADAYTSVDSAIMAASNPLTGGPREVWVAQGTYEVGQYSISPGMELYGGFSGVETVRSERNVLTNPTIFTGAAGSDFRNYLLSDGYPDSAQSGILIDGFTLTGPTGGVKISKGPGIVRNCTFVDLLGGGIANYGGPLTLEDSTFTRVAGTAVLGSPASVSSPASNTTIRRATFQYGSGLGISCYLSNLTVEDSLFQYNTNTSLDNYFGNVFMTRCRVVNNQSSTAIVSRANSNSLNIRQTLIAGNVGTGLDTDFSAALVSVTIAGNRIGIARGSSNALTLVNSIVAENSLYQIYDSPSPSSAHVLSANHSLVQGRSITSNNEASNSTWNPQFTNSATGDYTLAPRSPGVDAGMADYVNGGETDLAGNARIQSSAPDMGAYESTYTPNPLYVGTVPASLATTRGVEGVFTISGASTYTYTWQYFNGSTWVDITYDGTKWVGPNGVTINITTVNGVSTLTLPGTPLNTSGLQFRAVIDGQGITTAPATLTVSEPEIIYIDGSVAASGDGKSWATAYKTLLEVTNPSSQFDPKRITQARRIIYIAEGTYKPGSRFEISQRTEIYGGFPAGGGTFAARDPQTHPVILSGEIGDLNSTGDNAYPVLYINASSSPIGADTIVDGVTVDSGLVGVWVTGNAKPTLRNVTISHNTQNGLRLQSGGGRFENCQFLENTVNGGASITTGDVTFSGCSFRGNTTTTGGAGLLIGGGSVRVESSVFSGNRSGDSGGGIAVLGGSSVLVNSTLVGNYTDGISGGGGLYLYQGSLAVWNSILWANRSAQNPHTTLQTSLVDQQMAGSFDVQFSDIEGLTPSGSNISIDPLFVSVIDAASAPTMAGDFHIYGGSPVQDAGDDSLVGVTTLDADKSPRLVRTVDMGAYEVQGTASDPLVITQQPADLVIAGQGANEFHVGLTGTNYTFQWESATNGVFTPVVNGADFAGAQTATLQVVSRDPDLSGMVFRVKISAASGGQVTSRVASLEVYPTRYYVNAAAVNDSGKGITWASAFKTLGTALAKARVNPTSGVEIWVTGGIYSPSPTDTTASFPLRSKVAIYGGFTGTETALGQRDIVAHPTALRGIAGSTSVFAKTGSTAFTDVRIDGFAISDATTGIAMGQNVALTVANCSFSGLDTGISGDFGTLTVQNSQFTGLTQYGIYATSSAVSVADSAFTANRQGLVQAGGGSLSLVRSSFRGNGAVDVYGGGLRTSGGPGSVENCLFSGNYARYGGATYSQGSYGSSFNFRNCTVVGNFATDGAGAIYFTGGSTDAGIGIYNTVVWGNDSNGTVKQNSLSAVSYNTSLANNYFQPQASGDPQFVAPVDASIGGTTAGDYRLRPFSPLVNLGGNERAGSSVTDLALASRIFDSTVDIGAYELQVVPLRLTAQPTNTFVGANVPGSFSVSSNNANASYQWQVSTDGGNTWTDVVDSSSESGAQTATLTLGSFPSYNGRLYRAHVTTTDSGDLYTNAVTYTYFLASVQPLTGVREQMLTGRTSSVGFSVAGGVLPASIVDASFAVHGSQTGRLSLADGSLTGLTITGDTVTLQSAVPFKAGESVEVTTLGAVQRADGYTTSPMVYKFRAGSLGTYGMFPKAKAITDAPANAKALASGDVDGDGTVDLVIGGTDGAKVWLNSGAASFTATSQSLGSGEVSQVLLGSLGFSNKLDIVLRKLSGEVEIWRNDGNGAFTKTSAISSLVATSLGLADLNGDGALDLFIATAGADQVWFNNGAGTFADSTQRLGTSGAGVSVVFGDYHNTNSLAVFVANGSENMEIWNNDGSGHFTAGTAPTDSGATRLIAADFDKDGRQDLVAVRSNGSIRIYRQDPSSGSATFGTFLFTNNFQPVGLSPSDPSALGVADLDNDGYPDLFFHYPSGGTTQIWKGQGYSSGQMVFQRITGQPTLPLSKSLDLVDLNADGMMDSVFISASGVPTVALYAVTPATPTSLTATAISDTQISLAWTDNATTETGYSVERSPNGTNSWIVIASALPANATTYTDTNSPSTQYYYRVRCNIEGVLPSAYSNTASTTTPAATTAGGDAIAVLEDATATVLASGATSVLANDSNPDAGTLEATVVTAPAHGILALNANGTFSYAPYSGFYGSDSFTYRATNVATGSRATATVSIVVTRLNDAPTTLVLTPASGTLYTGQAAGLSVGTLSASDPDPEDLGHLSFSLVSGAGSSGNADFTISGTTLKTATPVNAANGLSRSVRIRVTDTMGAYREETFTVTFVQAPTAAPATYDGDEDEAFSGNLAGTGGATTLTYQVVSQPAHGTLTLNTDGSYSYTPNANYHGSDSFSYRVYDGALNSAPVTVTFNVASVDDAPTLDAIAPVTTVENTPVSFTLVGHDVDGDEITSYQLASAPTLGTVEMDGALVTYTPNRNALGTETLTFTVTAGGLTSAPRPVVVTTTPERVNSIVYRGLYEFSDVPPAATGDWTGIVPANISTPAHGIVTVEDGRLLYKHNGDAATADSFLYTLTSGQGDIRHVEVMVDLRDRVVDVTSGLDSGVGTLRAAIETTNRFSGETLAPAYTVKPDWLIRIQPAAGGLTTLSGVSNYGLSAGVNSYIRILGQVTIDAAAVPNYILTTSGLARHFLVVQGARLTLKNLGIQGGSSTDRNYSSPNPMSYGGAVLNFGSFIADHVNFRYNRADEGASIYNNGGSVVLTDCLFQENSVIWDTDLKGIVTSRNGSLSLTRVTFTNNTGGDGGDISVLGDGAVATVNVASSTLSTFKLLTRNGGEISVAGLPYARPDSVSRSAGQPVTIPIATLLANDSGAPFASVTFAGVSAQGVTITRSGDNVLYAAPVQFAAVDTFTYTVTDASGLASSGTVTVSIESAHGGADTGTIYRGLYGNIDVLANDFDDNGGTLSITAVSTPVHGTATIEDGLIHYVNDGSENASDSFTYSITNGTRVTENIPVTVTIVPRELEATSGEDSGPGTLRAALDIVNSYAGTNTPRWIIRIKADAGATWAPESVTGNNNYPDFGSAYVVSGNVLIDGDGDGDATGGPNFTLSGPQGFPGGRLFLVTGSLALENLIVANSRSYGYDFNFDSYSPGGAVLVKQGGKLEATKVEFRNNTAVYGAAIYNEGGEVTLTDSSFHDNVSPSNGFTPEGAGVVVSINGTLNLLGGVTIEGSGGAPALYVSGGTLNHSGTGNSIASYQSSGSVTIFPGAPVAAPDTVRHVETRSIRIPFVKLLANDTNTAGATITVAGSSANGVSITTSADGAYVTYNAPGYSVGPDYFTYTLTNAIGLSSTGTVNVEETTPSPVVTVAPRAGGGLTIQVKGEIYTTYRLQVSGDLAHWSTVTIEEPSFGNDFTGVYELYTDGGGNATFLDDSQPDPGTARFYRAQRTY